MWLSRRAEWVRQGFVAACAEAGVVVVDGGDGSGAVEVSGAEFSGASAADIAGAFEPARNLYLQVSDDELYSRIASAGWLGLWESYLAGQWRVLDQLSNPEGGEGAGAGGAVGASGVVGMGASEVSDVTAPTDSALVEFLSRLVFTGLGTSKKLRITKFLGIGDSDVRDRPSVVTAELPTQLLALTAGPNLNLSPGEFSSGVRTRSLEDTSDGGVVEITRMDPPVNVGRADFGVSLERRQASILDSADVRSGDRVLEWPSAGGDVALKAADRGADADVVATTDDHAERLLQRATDEGLGGVVQVLRVDDPVPAPREFDRRYEAIICPHRFETMGERGIRAYLRSAEVLLAADGTLVLQMMVRSEGVEADSDAVEGLMALSQTYVWPDRELLTLDDVRKLIERDTDLRIVAEMYLGGHAAETLQLNREYFDANQRVAAGHGFDRVFRRMWKLSLAIDEALLRTNSANVVQLTLQHR